MHLGFIGLGHLGRAVAGRLLECGHTLTAWNRTPGKNEGLAMEIADSPREVIDKADIVLVCLFDSHAVHEVLGAEDGLLAGDAAGKIIVDLTTNHFRMKLINNLTLASFMATIAEAVAMGEDSGLAKEEVIEILAAGGGNSLVLTAKRGKLLAEDFAPHFTNALIYKDLHCLQDLAYERQRPLFTGSVVKELYAKACAAGIAQEDFSAIYKLFKKD